LLFIATVRDASGAYYLSDLAAEPGVPGASRPAWVGRGADRLGLGGDVDQVRLAAVLAGRQPATGRRLSSHPTTVCAYDLTFAAPKSVSLLATLGPPEARVACAAAHDRAVASGLDYLEQRALGVRRGSGELRAVVPTHGLIGATFVHSTSRALDPHLHTHVVVANLAHDVEGRFGALDSRRLFAHSAAAGALYDAHLRHDLTAALGIGWARRRDGVTEIDGVDPVLVGAFSGRQAEIRASLGGRRSPATRRVAWASTRDPKASVPVEVAMRRAEEAARSLGCDPTELGRLGGRPRPGPGTLDEHRFAAVVSTFADGVARRDVVTAWSTGALDGAPGAHVTACVDDWLPVPAGAAERRHPGGEVVPAPYLLSSLGPRPLGPDAHRAWRRGAAVIEDFRHRWCITDPHRALGTGPTPAELAHLPAARLADHLDAQRRLAELTVQWRRHAAERVGPADRTLGR